jgi:STE24 endopeptidase
MGLLLLVLQDLLYLPIGIGRLYHARSWGMSNLELDGWLQDHAISFAVTLVIQGIVLVGFYAVVIGFPRTWWLLGALGSGLLAIAYAFFAPLFIDPLFNEFTPIANTEWSRLQPRVQKLVSEARVEVEEILVMNASRQSEHTNAYFSGFGSTRRIVLYDTLLKKHTDAEIESVLAHEIGHWQHDHIVKGIALGTCAALAGLFVLDRLLRRTVGRAPWHLQSIADPAGLPVILLLTFLGTWVAMPLGSVVSRQFERQADRTALELAKQPAAFIDGERKMAIDNKSNVAPAPWNVWLFASHPTTVERIRMADEWRAATAPAP